MLLTAIQYTQRTYRLCGKKPLKYGATLALYKEKIIKQQ